MLGESAVSAVIEVRIVHELLDHYHLQEHLMRVFFFSLAVASTLLFVACSDVVSPVDADPSTGSEKSGSSSILAIYMKYEGIKGECGKVEEAMDVYSGVGSSTAALLLPAVQKVREAAAQIEEGADREGNVDAKEAAHITRRSVKDFKLDKSPYGRDDAANVEFLLYQAFKNIQSQLDDAGVDSREIDAALADLFIAIAALSDERPEA